jgi:hypothetical protein
VRPLPRTEKGWSARGVVDAPCADAFEALVRYWRAHIEPTLLAGDDYGVVDAAARTISMHGDWWYQGTFSVQSGGEGTAIVVYEVRNVATRMRSLASLMHRGMPKQVRGELSEALTAISGDLRCETRVLK